MNKSINFLKLDYIGFILLCILFILLTFHYIINDVFIFYREVFSILFLFLWLVKIIYKISIHKKLHISIELLFLIIFPILLIIFSLFTNERNLYNTDLTNITDHIKNNQANIYILRNAFLYIPMVLYFNIRGLTKQEILFLCILLSIVTLFGIYITMNVLVPNIGFNIQYLFFFGNDIIPYNSYVPYLTFVFLTTIFLLFYDNKNIVVKFLYFIILLVLFLFIFISSSRQSLLFCIICTFYFFKLNFKFKDFIKLISIIIIFILLYFYIKSSFILNDATSDRYNNINNFFETSRLSKLTNGLTILNFYEYFYGAGLTSVIDSGPHNDYIRWLQRVGLFTMIIGFLPFVISFFNLYRYIKYNKSNIILLMLLSIFFTLFHSFFGYPREDAFQAPFSFLSISIWLGYKRIYL